MTRAFHDPASRAVTFLDERYYTLDNEHYYPSVTTILSEIEPMGYGYDEWLRNNGQESKRLLREAGIQGSKVHNAIEKLTKGEEVLWVPINDDGDANYTRDEWLMINRFYEFYTTYHPKIILQEFAMVSPELEVGGRIDMIADIDGERYLIDVKTSNYMHDTYEFQVGTYAMMFNLQNNPEDQIQHTAVLWLKAQTRGPQKKKIQGKGWQLKIYERDYAEAYSDFRDLQKIWKRLHPESKPANLILPDRLKLTA